MIRIFNTTKKKEIIIFLGIVMMPSALRYHQVLRELPAVPLSEW